MQEKIKISLSVYNTHIRIDPPIKGVLYQSFKKALGYKPANAVWMSSSNPNWDGWITLVCFDKKRCKCSLKKDGMHFPAGLFSQAKSFFKENNIDYSILDLRSEVNTFEINFNNNYSLRDYQIKIVDDSFAKTRGIVKAATGAGKTIMAAGIFSKIKANPSIFFVTSKDLMNQSYEEFCKFLEPSKIGIIGGGKFKPSEINVVTVQTAVRSLGLDWSGSSEEDGDFDDTYDVSSENKKHMAEIIKNAGCIVCDEVQHWAANTCQIISDYCVSAKYRYGISATPWRDMDDDILIDSCFGKKICDIDASFLIDKGVLVKPYINMIKIGSKMGGTYADVYKTGIVENDLRNEIIKNCAEYLASCGRKVLILVRQIKHGEFLEYSIPGSVFIHGSCSSKDREEHIKKMRSSNSNSITIASSIFDEGIDVKPLDALILAGGGKSQTRALQRIGRVIRPFDGKKDAIVVDFFDDMKYMRNHSKKRIKMYSTEKRFNIKNLGIEEIVKNPSVLYRA
jgi:superfamily II DNA or RNA helicase